MKGAPNPCLWCFRPALYRLSYHPLVVVVLRFVKAHRPRTVVTAVLVVVVVVDMMFSKWMGMDSNHQSFRFKENALPITLHCRLREQQGDRTG